MLDTDVDSSPPAKGVARVFAKGRHTIGGWCGQALRGLLAARGIYRASPDASALITEIAGEENSSAHLLNELEVGYRKFALFYARTIGTYLAIAGTGLIVSTALASGSRSDSADVKAVPVLAAATVAAVAYLFAALKAHRRKNQILICVIALLGALNAGCASLRNVADARLRDRFAEDLNANVKFGAQGLKECDGPRPYRRRVRGNAYAFRNALVSRLQDVASPDPEARSRLVHDLARVIVRVSNGRWDRIDDIVRTDPSQKPRTRLGRWFDFWVADATMKPTIAGGFLAMAGVLVASLGPIVAELMRQR